MHLAIDHTTKRVVCAFFDKKETLFDYYKVMEQILFNHGMPYELLTDRRTIFEYTKIKAPKLCHATFTNFSYAMGDLGVSLKCSSIPQTKRQIKRVFGYRNNRFPPAARVSIVSNIDVANVLLQKLVKQYNDKYELSLKSITSVFEKQMCLSEINHALTIMDIRKIDNGHCIKYKNQYYLLMKQYQEVIYLKKKTIVNVIETLDKQLYASHKDKLFILKMVDKTEVLSQAFDYEKNKRKISKKIYKPKMPHPWKLRSYIQYLEKQKYIHAKAQDVIEQIQFELEINE